MKVLVTGGGGLVGRALTEHCVAQGDEVFSYDHQTLDITNSILVNDRFTELQPDYVINCAAWTDVDGCEFDPVKANAVNAQGPENLALACREAGAGLITISTDYVFDGAKKGFYTQLDQPEPLSAYGHSKLAGERRSQFALARTIVVRTGFIFGSGGRNFLSTVVERAGRGETIKAIGDAWGTPTYAPHLAARLRELATLNIPGVYHVVNSGEGASYEEFAHAAFEVAEFTAAKLEPITMDSLHRPAPRPVNSRLKCVLSEALGLLPLPFWKDALTEFAASQIKVETLPHR